MTDLAEITLGIPIPAIPLDPAERARLIDEAQREADQRQLAALRQATLDRLPEQWRTMSGADMLSRVRCESHRDFAKSWNWGQPGAVLSGASRLGKTTAAAFVFRRLHHAQKGRWGALRWQGSLALVKASQSARQGLSRGEADPARYYETASVLFLDDLGKEPSNDWAAEILFEILDARYGRKLPTISTTELTERQLLDRYGVAVMARLLEVGGAKGRVISPVRAA